MDRQGALFLLSKWCKCSELGLRATVLACGSLLNNAFNLLTAYGIFDGMEGVMEYSAWRWYATLIRTQDHAV